MVLVFFSFSLVANLVAAPFNGMLAGAVEQYWTGGILPAGRVQDLPLEIVKAFGSESKKLAFFLPAPPPWRWCFSYP
jgi:CysZ protein